MSISLKAYAKINLMLSVGEALPPEHAQPGYHPIFSWFSAINLYDDVTIDLLPQGQPSRYDIRWANDAPRKAIVDWPLDKDLAVRAHRAVEGRTGKPLPIAMTVTKRIPVGAGLGGGSADAAACLLGLQEACGLDLDDESLREIAMTLGSDISFFIDGAQVPRPALISGLGETIERIEAIKQPIILIIPPLACSTAQVYKHFDETLAAELHDYRMDRAVMGQTGRERSTAPREAMVRGRVARMLDRGEFDTDQLFNDLAKPAFVVEPRLGQLVTTLSNTTRSPAHVTGSGSCVFLCPPASRLDWFLLRVQRACDALATTSDLGQPVVLTTHLIP